MSPVMANSFKEANGWSSGDYFGTRSGAFIPAINLAADFHVGTVIPVATTSVPKVERESQCQHKQNLGSSTTNGFPNPWSSTQSVSIQRRTTGSIQHEAVESRQRSQNEMSL